MPGKRDSDWGDAWMPNRITPDGIENGKNQLKELCNEAGRDVSSIGITVYGATPDPSVVDELFSAGAERVVLTIDSVGESEALAQLDNHANKFL